MLRGNKSARALAWLAMSAARAMGALVLAVLPVFAQVPQTLAFQGKLGDPNGNPLTGDYNFTFSIIPSTGGAAVYTETDNNVSVTNGIYTVYIGSYAPGGIPASTFNVPVVLQVSVDGQTLSPDVPIASVSSAFHAIYADQLLSPMTTATGGTGQDWGPGNAPAGSIPYFITNGSMTLLAPSLNTYVLTMSASGQPYWAAPGAASVASATNTWTAQQTFDNALYVSTSLALSGPLSVANGVGSYGLVLESSGTGLAPFWASIPSALALLNDTNTWTAPQTWLDSGTYLNGLLVQNSSLTLTGANGYITASSAVYAGFLSAASSVTASAFFGDGSHLSGINAGVNVNSTNTWTAQQNFAALIAVSSGITSSLNGPLALVVSGSSIIANDLMVVNGNGSAGLGIGINPPSSPLDVEIQSMPQIKIFNNGGNSIGSDIELDVLNASTGNGDWDILNAGNLENGNFAIRRGGGTGTEYLTITPSGFVGLGTTAPNAELEVSSPALSGTTNPILIVSTGAAAPDRLFIVNGDGDVGIGTASPAYNLDVSSYTRINGAVFVGAQTATWLETNSCPPPCFALNSTNYDLYSATGPAPGQWINERTSQGP